MMSKNHETIQGPPESTFDMPFPDRGFHFETKAGTVEWFADMRPTAGGVRAIEFHQHRGGITSIPNEIEIPHDRLFRVPV